MKKFIIPIILAAVLGVGGGVAAIIISRADIASADEEIVHEPKAGKYYLNGDKNSDLWITVNPDFLQLCGNDIDKTLMDAARKDYAEFEDVTEESIQQYFNELKALYCAEKVYVVKTFLPEKSEDLIKVSRDNKHTDRESLEKSDAAFRYNYEKNSIRLGLLGDFILVEE